MTKDTDPKKPGGELEKAGSWREVVFLSLGFSELSLGRGVCTVELITYYMVSGCV